MRVGPSVRPYLVTHLRLDCATCPTFVTRLELLLLDRDVPYGRAVPVGQERGSGTDSEILTTPRSVPVTSPTMKVPGLSSCSASRTFIPGIGDVPPMPAVPPARLTRPPAPPTPAPG